MSKKNKLKVSKFQKFLKVVGTTMLAVFLSVTLTGCSQKKTTGPSELVIWGFVDEDVFKPIIKDFSAANKGVNIKYVKQTFDGNYENNALNSILSGQGPDVWAMPNDWVYRHKDKLTPAPESLFQNKKIVMKDYFVGPIIQDNISDKQIYGLSPSVDILQVYYSPTLFEQAKTRFARENQSNQQLISKVGPIFSKFPITWDEFDLVLPHLTMRSGNNIQIAGASIGTSNNITHSEDILSLLMLQKQTKLISEDLTQANFNLPIKSASGQDVFPGKISLDFYTKYADPSSPTYTWNASMPNDVDSFVQGKTCMIFGYSNLAAYFRQVYPNFEFQQARIPQVGDTGEIVDYSKYTTYVVPEASQQKAAAWNFIVQLSTDFSSTYYSATKELSSKIQASDTVLKNRGIGIPDASQIKTAKTWNKGRYPVEVDSQLNQAITRVNNKSQNSQASLDTAAANITALLRKKTW